MKGLDTILDCGASPCTSEGHVPTEVAGRMCHSHPRTAQRPTIRGMSSAVHCLGRVHGTGGPAGPWLSSCQSSTKVVRVLSPVAASTKRWKSTNHRYTTQCIALREAREAWQRWPHATPDSKSLGKLGNSAAPCHKKETEK